MTERSNQKDAQRWRFTQLEGYFQTDPYSTDGDWLGYSVGIKSYGRTLNDSILGKGDTLQEAVDNGILNYIGF